MDVLNVFMKQVSARYRRLTKSEQIDLIRRAKDGDKSAVDTLFDSVMPMVVRMAKKVAYGKRKSYLMDMIQEGAVGMMNALVEFDLSFNVGWNTYGLNGARLAMLSFVERNKRHGKGKPLKANLRGDIEVQDRRPKSPDAMVVSEVIHTCKSVRRSLKRRDPRGFEIIKHRLKGGTLDTAGSELGISGKRASVIFHRTISDQLSHRVASVVVCHETAHYAITTLTR